MIRNIRLSQIDVNSFNSRLKYDEEEILNLSNSLATNGLLSPICVRKRGKRFEIVFGHRRAKAALLLGWKKIRAEVSTISDEEMVVRSVCENLARENLSDYEKAKSFLLLKTKFHKTHAEIGRLVGYSEAHITNYLRMLELFDESKLKEYKISDMIYQLTEHQARVLLHIPDENGRMKALKIALSEKMSVRDTQRMISRLGGWFTSEGPKTNDDANERRSGRNVRSMNDLNERDRVHILHFLEEEFNLPNGGDFQKYLNRYLFERGFSLFGAFPPYGRYDDFQALTKKKTWFYQEGKTRLSKIVDLRVQSYGNIAIATVLVDQKDARSGEDLPRIRGSVVFLSVDETWKIVHEHWSKATIEELVTV